MAGGGECRSFYRQINGKVYCPRATGHLKFSADATKVVKGVLLRIVDR